MNNLKLNVALITYSGLVLLIHWNVDSAVTINTSVSVRRPPDVGYNREALDVLHLQEDLKIVLIDLLGDERNFVLLRDLGII